MLSSKKKLSHLDEPAQSSCFVPLPCRDELVQHQGVGGCCDGNQSAITPPYEAFRTSEESDVRCLAKVRVRFDVLGLGQKALVSVDLIGIVPHRLEMIERGGWSDHSPPQLNHHMQPPTSF